MFGGGAKARKESKTPQENMLQLKFPNATAEEIQLLLQMESGKVYTKAQVETTKASNKAKISTTVVKKTSAAKARTQSKTPLEKLQLKFPNATAEEIQLLLQMESGKVYCTKAQEETTKASNKAKMSTPVVEKTSETQSVSSFEDTEILSKDELSQCINAVKERQRKIKEILTTEMTFESVSQFKEVDSSLQRLEKLQQDGELPTLEELAKSVQDVEEKYKNKKEMLRSEFAEAVSKSDHSAMEDLVKVKELLDREAAKELEAAKQAYQDAENACQNRCTSLGLESVQAIPQVPKLSSQIEAEINQGRAVIKEAMLSGFRFPAKKVPVEYLSLITKDWHENSKLMRGGQGFVYKGFDEELDCLVAVKKMPSIWDRMGGFQREVKSLSKLDHPNVVRLLAQCEDNNTSYLVYEYAAGGSIADVLKNEEKQSEFNWRRRVDAIMQLALALSYCNHIGVFHRDVKPQNICFDDENHRELVLIDFGVASETEGTTLTSVGGTPVFMAPEYSRAKGRRFDEKSEVYSFGVVALSIMTGAISSTDLEALVEQTLSDPSKLLPDPKAGDWDPDVSDKVFDIMRCCIVEDYKHRPSFQELLDELVPLRDKFTTALTQAQSLALEQKLSETMLEGTAQQVHGTTCACGRSAGDGVACLQGHAICCLCLESSVRRQVESDEIRCHVGSCDECFEIADLKSFVCYEVLAEYAIGRQKAELVNRRSNEVEKVLKKMQQQLNGIASGIAFVASKRSECPSLCILWPIKTGRHGLRPSKEYRLFFLCAYDRTPTKSYITLQKPRKWVQSILPALQFTLFLCKLSSLSMGIPLPLPAFIPGDNSSEQIQSIVDSLSDLLNQDTFRTWIRDLEKIKRNCFDPLTFKAVLCDRADKISAEVHHAILNLAKHPEDCGWEDEMVVANKGDEWAWVKKENKESWENSQSSLFKGINP